MRLGLKALPPSFVMELLMHLSSCADTQLGSGLRSELARYRYEVFAGRLGWALPCQGEEDQDQFDVPGAVHVVARDALAHMVGYARLLPTTGPYLLAELFPGLLGEQPTPRDPGTWELSRYAAMDTRSNASRLSRQAEVSVGKRVLLEAIRTAQAYGAHQLIFCTTVPIERLAMRWGVSIRRIAAPLQHEGQWLVAALIEFTPQTMAALSEGDEASAAQRLN